MILSEKIKIVLRLLIVSHGGGGSVDEKLREKVEKILVSRFSNIKKNGSRCNLWRYTEFSDIMTEAQSIYDALKGIEQT